MRTLINFLIASIIFLISCNKIEKKGQTINKSKELFYMINLPDTINSDVSVVFEIKLNYPIKVKKEDYFSLLILSDSIDITFDNVLDKKDNPFEITEISTNHWKVRRTFYKEGNYVVKGAIYVNALEIKSMDDGSFLAKEHEDLVPIRRKVYIK
jgi:hypothetical protein